MIQAIEAERLGKQYKRKTALQDCSFHIPIGHVAGLVGPNGAGKSTLLHLVMGLLAPDEGSIRVLDWSPRQSPEIVLPRVSFVAQDRPLYRSFTVDEILRVGKHVNPRWDQTFALERLQSLDIPLHRQIAKLSGGQQAQVSLILALAKRPELLVLDEPMAHLDPLARREFQKTLMRAVAEGGVTVLLSSHIIADLERFCDYLVLLVASQVQLAEDIEHLIRTHKLVTGPRERIATLESSHSVIHAVHSERSSRLLVRTQGAIVDPAWQIEEAPLEEIVLGYLSQPSTKNEFSQRDIQEVF